MASGAPSNIPSAKLTDRFLAYLIDTAPFGAGYYVTGVLLVARWRVLPNVPETWRYWLVVWIGLYVCYHWIGNLLQATVGKWIMGLRVRGVDGEPLGAARALVRALGILISTPLFNLGFLWALVQPDSRTWHDLLAASRVVEARPKTAAESLWIAAASMLVFTGILSGTWWFYMVRPTPMDRLAIDKARMGLQVLAEIEERYKAEHGAYTESLADLAAASGDVDQFRSALAEMYDPRHFRIRAGGDRYVLSARALDRRRTWVSLSGPPAPTSPPASR